MELSLGLDISEGGGVTAAAIDASVFDGGTIKLYTGAASNAAGDLLAQGNLPSRAFEDVSGGTRAKHGSWSMTATKNGAARGLLISNAGATINTWKTVTESGGGGDVIIDHSDVQINDIIACATMVWTPDAPVGGTTVFFDDFSSGGLAHTQNGISWISTVFVDVQTVSIARTGTKSARFRQGAAQDFYGSDPNSELRWDGMANLQEVFLEWYLYWPNGTEGVGPKAYCLGTSNDKFFRCWGGGNAGYNGQSATYNNKVGASTWGNSGHQDGSLGSEFCDSLPGTQYGMGEGASPQARIALLVDANRGRWMRVRARIKQATPANNDGVLQIWKDDTLIVDRTALRNGDIYGGATTPGYTTGYIMGACNNGWPSGQFTYLADVRISTGGFV